MYDFDYDGIPDAIDLDSDNDGIPDVEEAGGTAATGTGRIASFSDVSPVDGYSDALVGSPLPRPDSDGDGLPDYRDRDSDGDGIADVVEAGGTAETGGSIASFTDVTGDQDNIRDGWNDATYNSPLTVSDSDLDGFDNYVDIDSDNDGLVDNREAPTIRRPHRCRRCRY